MPTPPRGAARAPVLLSAALGAVAAGTGALVFWLAAAAGEPTGSAQSTPDVTVDDEPEPGVGATATAPARAAPTAQPVRAIDGPRALPLDSVALRAPPVSHPPPIAVHGSGWGHGVGLSQYGAQAQALAGRSHAEILAHYYPGTRLERVAEEAEQIRVNLFTNRGDLDRSHLRLRTSSRDGGPPDHPVRVTIGDGDPVDLPWPQTWTLSIAGDELVLTDNRGVVRRRGRSPARVRYAFRDGNPTLLRLPQLSGRSASTRLAGTFAWGELHLHHGAGQLQPVMILPLEHYLAGIAEVPSTWEPGALQAQAVAARTYAVRQMREPLGSTCRCHLGATPHHQVYAGYMKEGVDGGDRWRAAVTATRGQVLTHDGELAWTYYSSSHGGRSEHSEDSWAYSQPIPYLRSVDDPWSRDPRVGNPYAAWTRRIDNAEFAALVGGGLAEVRRVRVLERTAGDSPRVLAVHGVDDEGRAVELRWDGGEAGSAATALKLAFRAHLPSQQIDGIGFEPFHDDTGRRGEYETASAHRAGLLRGCDEGRRQVCPDERVDRGELALALTRAHAGAPDALADLDVAVGNVDRDAAVADAVASGLLDPCEGGCLDEPVTRAHAARAFAEALELDGGTPAPGDAADHAAADAIGAVTAAGLFRACADGAFCPEDPLTRDDLAVALHRGFNLP
jgi:SpoIID/LytB domain protein